MQSASEQLRPPRLAAATLRFSFPLGSSTPTVGPYVGPPPTPGVWGNIKLEDQLLHFPPRFLDKQHSWGSVKTWRQGAPLGHGDTVEINHLFLRCRLQAGASKEIAQEIVNNVIPALKPWMHLLADWIEVVQETFLERNDSPGERSIIVGGSELIPWYFDGERGHSLSQGTLTTPGVVIGREGMTLPEWHLALRLAELQQNPPTEYTFLRDARGSLRQQSTRRAVLDAATAAEISLAKLLDAQTASAAEPIRDAVRDGNNNLGRMTTTLRKTFKVKLPNDIQGGLAKPRNDAIHAGKPPTTDEATLALKIAEELVDLATPQSELVRLDP
jgi:hypothetical protein